ncbi:MAG: 50S ribosomal protein L19, partial [Patescibacteria group bacterium]
GRRHGAEPGATFTVRRVASGVGTEKTFPLFSPLIDKIEILRSAKVRRSKLYYIRDKSRREARRKIRHEVAASGSVAPATADVPTEAKTS